MVDMFGGLPEQNQKTNDLRVSRHGRYSQNSNKQKWTKSGKIRTLGSTEYPQGYYPHI
jgi:hypothetical protein